MGQETMQVSEVEQLAEASKACNHRYVVIEFQGVKLLLTEARLHAAIDTTWELTHDPGVRNLAERLGIKLRKFR